VRCGLPPLFFLLMKRDFKGVWIPKAVWLSKDLSLIEKCILVEIDSLDNDMERGCFASNAYFAQFFDLSESRIANILTGLKKRGYIKQVYFDGRTRGLRSTFRESSFTENGKADLPKTGKQNTRKREHNNTVDNKVENTSSIDIEEGFSEFEKENIGDVAAEFEQFGEPAPLKAEKKKTPPKLRESPPAAKEPKVRPINETYSFFEAWAQFAESKGIAVAKNATGTYKPDETNMAHIKQWRTWCASIEGATGGLDDWHVFLQAAWEHGGKWYQANFTPRILNSKRQELMAAFARYKAKNEPDMSMVGMSIDEILKNI